MTGSFLSASVLCSSPNIDARLSLDERVDKHAADDEHSSRSQSPASDPQAHEPEADQKENDSAQTDAAQNEEKPGSGPATAAFLVVEHWLTIGIGLILIVATLIVLTSTLAGIWGAAKQWPETGGTFEVVDKLLFVLMLVEILHTVRASIETSRLAIEPFLIVGLIACVRRMLVVTLETAGQTNGAPAPPFEHAMIELGVLGGLILVLISSITLSRFSRWRFHRQ